MSPDVADANRVQIFDTTLRDGEQSPGISLNTQEKLEIAHQLARLGVDVIEAGFPITSPGDYEAVQEIARKVEGPVICALARTAAGDIDRAWEALRDCSHDPFCPLGLLVHTHLIFHHLLHHAVDAVGLGIDIKLDERVSCERLQRFVERERILGRCKRSGKNWSEL